MAIIADRIQQAQQGTNPCVIAKMNSGWAVLGDTQPLAGYCLLLADPVVSDLNALDADARKKFLEDMTTLGDAIIQATNCARINYEILGNLVTELHAHLTPRYNNEPQAQRYAPPMSAYDWNASRPSEPAGCDQSLIETIRENLKTKL